jgi:uncharacterized protein (DUF1800 family)
MRASADPRGFLKTELLQPAIALLDAPALPQTKAALTALYADQQQKKIERERAATKLASVGAQISASSGATAAGMMSAAGGVMMTSPNAAGTPWLASTTQPPEKTKPTEPPLEQKLLRADAMARFQKVAYAEVGFVERLVHFWSNHFCVSVAKGPIVRATAGSFEREAIRPHVLGRFADMLKAVESHPAMLFYLDNAQSFGPNSPAGRNGKRGLNENLAREILELHTLGVAGGYTQADVTSLARIITGWTFAGREGRIGEPGAFVFFGNGHEPGDHTLLGKVYREGGMEQGEAALADLARHPATARHVALKLARHFVADDPPKSLVERLAKVFHDSEGDLKAVTNALVDSQEAWTAPLAKMRTPEEFVLAAIRAIDRMPEDASAVLGPLNIMGMPFGSRPARMVGPKP